MSALFKPRTNENDWAKLADRRSPTPLRLRAALFLSYNAATGAKEFDTFRRDAPTWAAFENAVSADLGNFRFVDKSRDAAVSPPAVLADAMYHLWTVESVGRDLDGRPTTIATITELANYLCAVYETSPLDIGEEKRNWFGLNRKKN
jgi:hypothetical protein